MPTGYLVPTPPWVSPKADVVAKTADYTLVLADMGKQITNTAAIGTVVLTLPAPSAAAGMSFRVQVTAAQIVRVDPGTGKVYLAGSGVADKYVNIAGVIGNYADFYSDGIDWMVTNYAGVVTKEA